MLTTATRDASKANSYIEAPVFSSKKSEMGRVTLGETLIILTLLALLPRHPYFRADNFTVRAIELIRIKQRYFSERTFRPNISLASMTFVLPRAAAGAAKGRPAAPVSGAWREKSGCFR